MAVQRRLDAIAAMREGGRAPVICLLDQGPPSQVAELGAGRWAGDRSTRRPGAEYATGDVRTQLRRPDDLLLLARPSRRDETFRRRPRSHGSGALTLSMMLGLGLMCFFSIFVTCSSIFPLHISYHPQLGFSLLKASLLPRESVLCALNFAQRSVSPLETTPGGLTTPRRPRITPSEGYQTSAKAIWRCARYGPPSREQVQLTRPDATSRGRTSRAFRGLSFTAPHGRTRRRRAAPSPRTALIQHDRGAARPCLFKGLLDCCAGAMATGAAALLPNLIALLNHDDVAAAEDYLKRHHNTSLSEEFVKEGALWLEKVTRAIKQGDGKALVEVLLESRIRDPTNIVHGNYLAQARYTLTYNDALRIVDRLLLLVPRRRKVSRQVLALAQALADKSEDGLFELLVVIPGEGDLAVRAKAYLKVVAIDCQFDRKQFFQQWRAIADSLGLTCEVRVDFLRGSRDRDKPVQLPYETKHGVLLRSVPLILCTTSQFGDSMTNPVRMRVNPTLESVKASEGWYNELHPDDEEDVAEDVVVELDVDEAGGDEDEENGWSDARQTKNKNICALVEAAAAKAGAPTDATGVSLDLGGALGLYDALLAVPDVQASTVLRIITAILPFAKPGALLADPYDIAMGLATLDNHHYPTRLQPLLDALEAARNKDLLTPTATAGRDVAAILEHYALHAASEDIASLKDIKYFEYAEEALRYFCKRRKTDSDTDRGDVLQLYQELAKIPNINASAAFRVFTEAESCTPALLSNASALREAIDASGTRSEQIYYALKKILEHDAPDLVYELLERLGLYKRGESLVPYEEAKLSSTAIAIAEFCAATKATSEQAKRLYDAIGSDQGSGIRGMQGSAALQLFTQLAKDASFRGRGLADAPRIRVAAETALSQGSYRLYEACGPLLKAIETEVFANTDEKNRVSMVLEICNEIDFHWETVAYAKYGDCIKKNHRGCVETLCEAAERVKLRLIDKDAADALFALVRNPAENTVLRTLAAALQLDPERVGNIFEDADYIALAMSEAKVLKGRSVMKYFVDSIQDPGSQQRLWLHEKGVHSKNVTVPTWEAVLKALGDARIAEDQKRARTPAPPPETRKKSTRERKKARR